MPLNSGRNLDPKARVTDQFAARDPKTLNWMRLALDKSGKIVYYEGNQDAPRSRGESKPEVLLALAVGFVLGVLLGYLMRSGSRQYEAGVSGHEGAWQICSSRGAGALRPIVVCTGRIAGSKGLGGPFDW